METIWHLTADGVPAKPGRGEEFVHASFTSQVEGTLAEHFKVANVVHALELDRERLGERLKVEPSRDGMDFPHVYGKVTNADVVQRVVLFRKGAAFDLSALG